MSGLLLSLLAVAVTLPAQQNDREDHAWEAWNLRQIEEAAKIATEILAEDPGNSRALHLRILASYLMGDYEASLADYERLDPEYEDYGELAQPITDAFVHLERLEEAAVHARQVGLSDAVTAWLVQRAGSPMTVALDATTVLPFVEDDFLSGMMPAIPIELNGETGVGHLDTGGPFIVMGPEKAASLGIETTQVGTGVANAQETRVFAGIAESLRLGNATLANVPVMVVETLPGVGKQMVILGTNIFQQFLTTWDNQERRLVLTPRGSKHQRRMHLERFAAGASAMDFYMAGDHYMWAKGAVGDHAALYFVDTGLVTLDDKGRQPSGAASRDFLSSRGYDVTDMRYVESRGPIRLGPISSPDGSIRVWSDRRNLNGFGGLTPDVLLSFGFLKNFNWTLDFETHTWYFTEVTRPEEPAVPAGPILESLAPYVGRYEVTPGVNLDVSLSDAQLLLQATGQPKVPMTWVEGSTFEIALAGATIVFEKDDSGAVTGLVLKQGGRETRARKID